MAEPATDTFGGLDLDTVVRGALPQSSVDAPKIQANLIDIGKQEAAQKGALADRMVSGIESDKATAHRAREGIEPIPDMKWDADKEREKYTTDPMQQFGSLGFIAVTLASAFTRQPMINALTAAGSFMDAANKKNDKDYDRAYEAFKENASLAMKRHEMQREAFDDAIKLMNSDVSAGKAELAAVADKFGDKRAQALLEGGYMKELIEYQNSQREAYAGILRQMPQIEAMHARRQDLSLDPDYRSGDPTRMAQAEVRLSRRTNLTPEQQIWDKHQKENPESDAKKDLEFYKELRAFGAKTTLDAARRDEIYRKEIEDWKSKHPGEEVPADVMKKAHFTAIGKSGATFSDDALETMSELYLDGNRTVLTNVGRGVQGPENLDKFWTILSKKMTDRGFSADDVNRAQQEFAASTAGLRVLAQRAAMLKLASNEAEKLVPRVKEISDRIDRTRFPSLNSVILAAERGTGGEDVVRMGIAAQALVNVYARILKPTGQVTVDDMKRAEHILDVAWSKGQINAALDQMMKERDSAEQGLYKTMVDGPRFRSGPSKKESGSPASETAPVVIEYDAQGNRVSK